MIMTNITRINSTIIRSRTIINKTQNNNTSNNSIMTSLPTQLIHLTLQHRIKFRPSSNSHTRTTTIGHLNSTSHIKRIKAWPKCTPFHQATEPCNLMAKPGTSQPPAAQLTAQSAEDQMAAKQQSSNIFKMMVTNFNLLCKIMITLHKRLLLRALQINLTPGRQKG